MLCGLRALACARCHGTQMAVDAGDVLGASPLSSNPHIHSVVASNDVICMDCEGLCPACHVSMHVEESGFRCARCASRTMRDEREEKDGPGCVDIAVAMKDLYCHHPLLSDPWLSPWAS